MKRSFIIAALLAIAVAGWILSGQFTGGENRAEAQKPPAELHNEASIPQVRIRRQSAEPYAAQEIMRGRTEALRSVDLKAETHGRVVEMGFERGDRLEKGQTVVRLALESRQAAVSEAKALREQRKIEYEAAKRLKEKGFRAQTQLSAAEAALEAAQAAVRRAEVELNNTRITAPFDAVVDDRYVDLGDFLEMGNPVARIVDLDPILVVAQVNELKVGQIEVGAIGQAKLVTGLEVAGPIRFVASMANPSTRTFRVEMEVSNPDGAISDGISAEIQLTLEERLAHKVSPGILTLSDEGAVGVKTVTDDNLVRFLRVQILDTTSDGVWLGGLPEEVTFVTVGQEFVADGQEVRPVDEASLETQAEAPTS